MLVLLFNLSLSPSHSPYVCFTSSVVATNGSHGLNNWQWLDIKRNRKSTRLILQNWMMSIYASAMYNCSCCCCCWGWGCDCRWWCWRSNENQFVFWNNFSIHCIDKSINYIKTKLLSVYLGFLFCISSVNLRAPFYMSRTALCASCSIVQKRFSLYILFSVEVPISCTDWQSPNRLTSLWKTGEK